MTMSYWSYYLVWLFLAYGVRQPWLLGGVLVFLLLRRWIPDPGAVFKALRRGRALRAQVRVNAANVTARRDLAEIYLDLLRPRAALPLLEEALARDPDSAELLYLKGMALHRARRHAESLEPVVRAVALNPSLRWGEPYRVAGDALAALGRFEEAIDSYERLARINSSDVGVHTALARAHAKTGDREAARASVYTAIETFHQIPSRMRRRAFARWLDAQRLRITLLREPMASAIALALVAAMGAGVRYAAPLVRHAVARRTPSSLASNARAALVEAIARCGSQDTSGFQGEYAIEPDSVRESSQGDPPRPEEFVAYELAQFAHFRVLRDRIRSGTTLVQEFCLTRVLDRSPDVLHAEAIFHEDIEDPGDAVVMEILFEKIGDRYRFSLNEVGETNDREQLWFRRVERGSH